MKRKDVKSSEPDTMEQDCPNIRNSRSSLKNKKNSKEKSIHSIHMPEIVSFADEPVEEDPLFGSISDPLSEPPLSDTIDSREFSEERRVQGGVVPFIDIEVTDDDIQSMLFETLTETEPIIEKQSTVLKSKEEQISVHGQVEETSTPPSKFMVLKLKKLTQQDLKKVRVGKKLIREKLVCKYLKYGGIRGISEGISEEISEEIQKHNLDSRSADSLPCRNILKKWVVQYSEDIMKKVISNLQLVKNYFLSMDIWSQPGLDKFYLGIVAIYYNHTTEKQEVAALACRDFPHILGHASKSCSKKSSKNMDLTPEKLFGLQLTKGQISSKD